MSASLGRFGSFEDISTSLFMTKNPEQRKLLRAENRDFDQWLPLIHSAVKVLPAGGLKAAASSGIRKY